MNLQAISGKTLSILAAIVAVAAVATSIWLNPPSENRARLLDDKRVQGLERTNNAVCRYYDNHDALPADLKVLDGETNQSIQAIWHDPETHEPVEYQITGARSFRLCAKFARSSDRHDSEAYDFKEHGAGRDCFDYTVGLPKK
jgi:hypothetical protein